MTMTADALWLDTAFAGYDNLILRFAHKLAEIAGPVLTPLNKLITLLGEKGILFFLLAIVFMLIPRYRKAGVCIFGAVCCGALLTNIILKDSVARLRPFENVDLYRQWWEFVGSPAEDGFSFPSGHATAAAAGVTGLCLMRGRKWVLPGVIWVLLMMFSRNYLMAHYPSDVLFGMLIGVFSGFVAAGITVLIFRFLEAHRGEGAFYDFVLDAGIPGLSSKRSSGENRSRSGRKSKAASISEEDTDDVEISSRYAEEEVESEVTEAPAPTRSRHAAARAKSGESAHASHSRSTRSSHSSGGYVPKH